MSGGISWVNSDDLQVERECPCHSEGQEYNLRAMKRLEIWYALLYLSEYLRVAGASTADTLDCPQKGTSTLTMPEK